MGNTSTRSETKSSRESASTESVGFNQKTFEELYVKNDFKGAASYLIQNKQQLNSGIFHYNLGTVYSKLNDFPAARFHLEKAIKEGYVSSSSLNNLNFVNLKLQVDDLSTSSNFYDQCINSTLAFPSSAYLSFSLIIALASTFILKSKKTIKKTSIALAIILILLPIAFFQFYLSGVNYAIALKDVPVYEGPSKIFHEKGVIHAGSKIILGDFKEGWFFVKNPISLSGWVSKDQLGLY
jgi:tetratricopeptide (TPR) repeat protein